MRGASVARVGAEIGESCATPLAVIASYYSFWKTSARTSYHMPWFARVTGRCVLSELSEVEIYEHAIRAGRVVNWRESLAD